MPATPTATVLQDGGVLNATNGSWLDLNLIGSFSYQWLRCQATCTSIDDGSGVGQNYTLKAADVGQRMRVIVTAHVLAGATSVTSLDTGVVAPLNTAPSAISCRAWCRTSRCSRPPTATGTASAD